MMNGFAFPKKRFGQNFLQNKSIATTIVESLQIKEGDVVLEIGPGRGILTEILSKIKCRSIYAIEIDSKLADHIHTTYSPSIKIIQQDVLSFSFENYFKDLNQRIKIIGNIPYNITSPILFHILDNNSYISHAVLMVQKEVADRLTAKENSKEYGILTIMTNVQAEVEKIFNVNRNNFHPQPNVDSAVIKVSPVKSNFDDGVDFHFDLFKSIVRTTFNNRRKMLKNTMKKILNNEQCEMIQSVSLKLRPENLSIDDFKNLTEEVWRLKQSR